MRKRALSLTLVLFMNNSCATEPKPEHTVEAIDGDLEYLRAALVAADRCGVEGVTMVEVHARPHHLMWSHHSPMSPEVRCFVDWIALQDPTHIYRSGH